MLTNQPVGPNPLSLAQRSSSYPWVIVSLLWVSHTVYFMNYMTVGTLAPFIQPELKLSSAQVGFLCSAMTIGTILIQIPAGMLCDRYGTRWVMGMGLWLTGSAAMALSWAHGYGALFGLLVLAGVGIGCNQAPSSKAIIMWFPSKGRATAMGAKQTGINMGGILASVLLPAIALHYGDWRFSFRGAGLASWFSALSLLLLFKDPPKPAGPSRSVEIPRGEVRRLILHRDFLLICFYGILLMITQYSFAAYFFLYVTRVLGRTIREAGFLMAVAFAVGAVGRIGWGVMSDYLLGGRRRPIFMWVGVMAAFSSLCLLLLKSYPLSGLVLLAVMLFGATGMGWNAVYLTLVGEFPRKELTGIATGVAFVITNVGVVVGPPLFGFFVDLSGGYGLSWLLMAFCMLGVALLSKIQREERMAAGD